MPATKDNLKYKYNRLGKELDTIRSEYEDNVQSVIHDLERRYNETRNWPLPCYGKLKRMIKDSTNDVVISKCRVPVHEHSIKNMGDRKGKWVFVFLIWNFKYLQLYIKKLLVIFIIMKWWCEHTKTQKAQSRFEI